MTTKLQFIDVWETVAGRINRCAPDTMLVGRPGDLLEGVTLGDLRQLALPRQMTDAQKVRALSDALNDIISIERKMRLKGALKPGKLLPEEVVNMSIRAARDALGEAGIPVRKTGRI